MVGRPAGVTVAHLIDGKPDAGDGNVFETLSPIDHTVLAKVARGGAAEIDRAARAASKPAPKVDRGKRRAAPRKKP